MIKTCVIGAGMMGQNHIKVLSDMENIKLIGISDVIDENLNKVKKYNIPLYKDYKEMIEKEKPNFVSIVVPTALHAEIALYLINKHIHVLIEKPIADTIENANKIIIAAKKNNVKATVGHIERFNPAIRELKEEIKKGKLGKSFKVDVNRIGPFPKRIRDVGVVIDLAVHDIDIIRYVLDDEPVRIYAEVEKNIHTTNEDILSATIKMKKGTICHLNINWLSPRKVREFNITGEKGMFVADYLARSLTFYENDFVNTENYNSQTGVFEINEGKMIKYNTKDKDLLTEELKSFIDAIVLDKEPEISLEDGTRALEIALQILESAKDNEVIRCSNK